MSVDFFISRAGADAAQAKWIAQCLSDAGYTVRLQDWDFRPGQDFIVEMDSAMREADRTIAVLSRAYDRALYTVPEWRHAVALDPTDRASRLIPVRVDDVVVEGILRTRIFIDLVGLPEAQARQALLDGVRPVVTRSTDAVAFPGSVTTRVPGSLPPAWRIPWDRNPVFTGREEELTQIRSKLESADPPPLVVALVGLGGVGKTALAVEYAYRYRSQYKVVWWVRADRFETVVDDLAHLAEALELADSDEPLSVRAARAREWLSNHDQWVLVLDDAQDASVVRQAIPQGGAGHVLVTSRGPAWRRHAAVIEMASLAEAPATELLARRSGQPQDTASTRLANALGGLPIALELAGAFLEQQGIDAAEYHHRLQRAGGLPDEDTRLQPPDYHRGLRGVWAESFRTIARQSPLATDLLRLAAFLAPDDVPRPAIVRGAHCLPGNLAAGAADPDGLADLVAVPRAFSVVTTHGDGFSVHRLIQAVIRDALEPGARQQWAGAAVLMMDHVLPRQSGDVRLWSRAGRLIGHALTAADHGTAEAVEAAATMRLLDRGATFLTQTGGDAESIKARREAALTIGETMPEGPPSWLLNNQGLWLMQQGALDPAERLLERALQATRMAEGGGAPALGTNWVNLGGIAKQRGQLDRARTCFERGLTVLSRLPGVASTHRATAHSMLGQVLFEQGEHDRAAAHFAASVREYDAALGPASHDSLLARTFLAQALGEDPARVVVSQQLTPESIAAEEGRLLADEPAWLDEAERLLRKAVTGGEPGAAVELASLLRSQPGHENEGLAVLEEAAARGDRHALYWYARELAQAQGEAAEPVIRQSVDAGNVFSWYDLGLVLATDETRWPEAEAAFRSALDGGFEEARNDLAILLCTWPGRETEGEAEFVEGGRRGQARCWFNLAQYLWQKPDRIEGALTAFRFAGHAGYLRAWGTVAYGLESLGRLDEALDAFHAGIAAGDAVLTAHVAEFLQRHPDIAMEPRQAP